MVVVVVHLCLLGPVARMTSVMDEEEYQKHRVRRGKRNAGDDVDGLGDPYRMWRHFAFVVAAVVSNILFFLENNTTTLRRRLRAVAAGNGAWVKRDERSR